MNQLTAQIISLGELKPEDIGSNKINSFLPYRKGAKEFDFEAVGSSALSSLMGREVKRTYTFDKFRDDCLQYLKNKLSDSSVLADLEKMYFTDKAITKTSPEFLLLDSQSKGNASTKHLIGVFLSFLLGRSARVQFSSKTSFIERIFLDILNRNLKDNGPTATESCYLPFVADRFYADLLFLSKHPDYFLDQIGSCIELYTFIYCSQLGLNIRSWAQGVLPESKPLYFILDTEKASSERSNLVNFGYRSVADPMAEVFPILSMLEHFNNDATQIKMPLWAFSKAIRDASEHEQQAAFQSLRTFAKNFREERKLSEIANPAEDAIDAMRHIIMYGTRQFLKTVNTGRHRVQQQYMEVFDKEVAKNFIQVRGRSGKVLVVNQDFILLLTNLTVGDRKSLRFQELLVEFQSRGFYFDKSSQQALINFYERVGNVDRMSDSGDAVYVRNTI